jgi:error-prone DNA polymerase
MSMLPRLRPRNFYDLVIEVAIVRPGPIVGDMVHPYLKRRNGEEAVEYPDEAVKAVLGKTLGVPLFQEQAMKLAMVAAGFTAGEADQLRRAIAAWKTKQKVIYGFGKRIIDGMVSRGYQREFAERCFEQLKGFSEYGFPESHAASFALLVYASAWLKCYYPAEFAAALINSQPMGFYAPAQIVRDAREHGVDVRPIDVNISGWECSIESDQATKRRSDEGGEQEGASATRQRPSPASLRRSVASSLPSPHSTASLRLGLRLISGLSEAEARRIERAVAAHGPFASITALWRASGVKVSTLRRLAHADAFGSMGLDRQHALWEVRALKDEHLPLFDQPDTEAQTHESAIEMAPASSPLSLRRSVATSLPPLTPARHVLHDYQSTGLSLKAHPVSFIRDRLADLRVSVNAALRDQQRFPHGASVAVAGVVLVRQRPGTASGVVFMTIEDETGVANLIVWPRVYQQFRRSARHSVIIIARGRVQRDGEVVHVLVRSIEDAGDNLAALEARSRDFR